MKNYLKGIAVAIFIGLVAYAIISGVNLAERYVEAKEIEARYEVIADDRPYIIDKKGFGIYIGTHDGFVPLNQYQGK